MQETQVWSPHGEDSLEKEMTPHSSIPVFIYLFFKFYFIFKLYIIVLVLPNIKMNLPQLYIYLPI